ncbi:reverse transcriptase domain-containing protein [Tanacetum coccineum]
MANTTPTVTTITKPATKEKTLKDADATPRAGLRRKSQENKNKRRLSKLKCQDLVRQLVTVTIRETESAVIAVSTYDRHVLDRLGHRRQSAFDRLSDTYSASTPKSGPDRENSRERSHSKSRPHRRDSSNRDRPRSRDCSRGVEEPDDNTRDGDQTRISLPRQRPLPLCEKREGKHKSTDEDDLAVPWICEEVDPSTLRIRNFKSSRKTRMPNNVKTYDGTGDPEDHVKIFQAAAQVERWAMPTWCHMFNSTLIGAAIVWFDELPPESIDGYKDLKAVFLAYFMQQKKYVKDPVEIHNIKQRDEETIEEFVE